MRSGLCRAGCLCLMGMLFGMGSLASEQPAASRRRLHGAPTEMTRTADDARIPAPEQLSTETDSRDFVESFIVGLDRGETALVYGAYFNRRFRKNYTLQTFVDFITNVRQIAGPLKKISIQHLREQNRRYEGADGGFADYLLEFEKDPKVALHVEFRRNAGHLWKVQSYFLSSSRLNRILRERGAHAAAQEKPPAGPDQTRPSRTPRH